MCSGMHVVGVQVPGGESWARASGAGFGCNTLNPHCPRANPPTVLGAAPPSPNCTPAVPPSELPKQVMFPLMTLLPISIASGSPMVLLFHAALPPIWTRSDPSQHDVRPLMLKLPPTVASSKSV